MVTCQHLRIIILAAVSFQVCLELVVHCVMNYQKNNQSNMMVSSSDLLHNLLHDVFCNFNFV